MTTITVSACLGCPCFHIPDDDPGGHFYECWADPAGFKLIKIEELNETPSWCPLPITISKKARP